MKQMQDKELLEKLHSPHENETNVALKILYKTYYHSIKRFIKNNQGSEDDAKDVFQDAIIIFYKQIKNEDFELKCSIHTYLYSVSRNLWLKRLAVADRETPLNETHEFIPLKDTQLTLLYKAEESAILMSIIERLGEECRKILVASFFEKKKMSQIAITLGYASEQAVRNKKYKCMNSLKDLAKGDAGTKELFLKS
ncbi:MAG: sigma-70 family RNA polymerase sigma factor [Saprospiraceae bacterium]